MFRYFKLNVLCGTLGSHWDPKSDESFADLVGEQADVVAESIIFILHPFVLLLQDEVEWCGCMNVVIVLDVGSKLHQLGVLSVVDGFSVVLQLLPVWCLLVSF